MPSDDTFEALQGPLRPQLVVISLEMESNEFCSTSASLQGGPEKFS